MKIKKLSQTIYLLLLLLILSGWQSYRVNNETPNANTQIPIEVRSAIIFNDSGESICHVNLKKDPDLIPNFAQLSENSAEKTAISIEEFNIPSCTNEYLNQLKKIATNNIVLNSDSSHIHKTSWSKVAIGLAACAVGAGGYYIQNYIWPDSYKRDNFMTDQNGKKHPIPPPIPRTEIPSMTAEGIAMSVPIGASIGILIRINKEIKYLTKNISNSAIPSSEKEKMMKELIKLRKNLSNWIAVAAMASCYWITDAGRAIYIEYNSW